MRTSRKRNFAVCELVSASQSKPTWYGGKQIFKDAFPVLLSVRARPWRCCRLKTRPVILWSCSAPTCADRSGDYDPDKLPLFVGLSVTPSVDLWSKPTGANAGKFLQEIIPVSSPAAGDAGKITSASSVAVPSYPAAAVPRAVNPWIVALAVVIPTFMEVLDTTIANVALRHIAGGTLGSGY